LISKNKDKENFAIRTDLEACIYEPASEYCFPCRKACSFPCDAEDCTNVYDGDCEENDPYCWYDDGPCATFCPASVCEDCYGDSESDKVECYATLDKIAEENPDLGPPPGPCDKFGGKCSVPLFPIQERGASTRIEDTLGAENVQYGKSCGEANKCTIEESVLQTALCDDTFDRYCNEYDENLNKALKDEDDEVSRK